QHVRGVLRRREVVGAQAFAERGEGGGPRRTERDQRRLRQRSDGVVLGGEPGDERYGGRGDATGGARRRLAHAGRGIVEPADESLGEGRREIGEAPQRFRGRPPDGRALVVEPCRDAVHVLGRRRTERAERDERRIAPRGIRIGEVGRPALRGDPVVERGERGRGGRRTGGGRRCARPLLTTATRRGDEQERPRPRRR